MLDEKLLDRVRARAADPDRCNDSAGIGSHSTDLGSLLGGFGAAGVQFKAMQGQLGGLMGQFAAVMKGFGVEQPMPHAASGDRAAPPPANAEQIEEAEQALGFTLPDPLRQLYGEVANGGFGPGDGLYPLDALVAQFRDFTDAPFGPQGQAWPVNLLPICHDDPGEICLDRESGKVLFWDPEELSEGVSNKYWLRSFKEEADSLAELFDQWVGKPTAMERMQAQRAAAMANPMETHIKNLIESCGRMTADERAALGFDGDDWQEKIRQQYSKY